MNDWSEELMATLKTKICAWQMEWNSILYLEYDQVILNLWIWSSNLNFSLSMWVFIHFEVSLMIIDTLNYKKKKW